MCYKLPRPRLLPVAELSLRDRLVRVMRRAKEKYLFVIGAERPAGEMAECGCFVLWSEQLVTYCPMHAAAPEMRVMLEGIEDGILAEMGVAAAGLGDKSLLDLVNANRAAIREVIDRPRSAKAGT